MKRPKAAGTSGSNAATLKQGFPSRSREGPNRVPFARAGIAARGRTFRAASEAAEGRENERFQRGRPQAAFPLALARGPPTLFLSHARESQPPAALSEPRVKRAEGRENERSQRPNWPALPASQTEPRKPASLSRGERVKTVDSGTPGGPCSRIT